MLSKFHRIDEAVAAKTRILEFGITVANVEILEETMLAFIVVMTELNMKAEAEEPCTRIEDLVTFRVT